MTDNQAAPVVPTTLTEEQLLPEAFEALRRGVNFFKDRKIDEAEMEFVKAIDMHPSLSPLYNVFALLKIARRGLDTLKESVYMALTTNPAFMDDFVKEGIALMDKGRFDEAEDRFQKALTLNPENSDAHFRIGFLYATQKKYQKAIEVFENLTQIDPENINAFFMLGVAYSEVREYYPAIANLQHSLRLQPAFVEARLTLADAYHNQGKYLISLKELETLESYIPDEDTTYLHRGMLLMELERFNEAIPYFEKVIMTNPRMIEAYELLVGLYEQAGRLDDAHLVATKALELDPQNTDMQAAVARLTPQIAAG